MTEMRTVYDKYGKAYEMQAVDAINGPFLMAPPKNPVIRKDGVDIVPDVLEEVVEEEVLVEEEAEEFFHEIPNEIDVASDVEDDD